MLLLYAGCVFAAFILCISGVHGQTNNTCALQGSLVDLCCSTKNSTSRNRWYTVHRNGSSFVQEELSADGSRVIYQMFRQPQPTLRISELKNSDANVYCCRENRENPELCWQRSIQLSAADPEDHRCLKVTYGKGEMCRYQTKSVDETCSIIYPRVLSVSLKDTVSEGTEVTLTCRAHCGHITNQQPTYTWYFNNQTLDGSHNQRTLVKILKSGKYSCAARFGEFWIFSSEKTIQVISNTHIKAAATGAGFALLVTLPAIIFIWIRTKKTRRQSSTHEETHDAEQLSSTHLYENIPAQPPEQHELYYSTVNIQPTAQTHQPREHELAVYAVVSVRP